MVDQDHAALRVDVVAQHLDPVLEEEHHRGVVVLAVAVRAAVEEVADRVDADDVDRRVGEGRAGWRGATRDAALRVEQHLQLRRGDEGVARGGEDLRVAAAICFSRSRR